MEKPQTIKTGIQPRRKGGRPKGSKNKSTILGDLIKAQFDDCLTKKFPELLEKTLELADKGNPTALKIIWDRLLPPKKVLSGEKNEGLQSGVTITINAIPGPDGSGVTIEGERVNGKEREPNTATPGQEHLLWKRDDEGTSEPVETVSSGEES